MSQAPRPKSRPLSTVPEYGSSVDHAPRSPGGTTSM